MLLISEKGHRRPFASNTSWFSLFSQLMAMLNYLYLQGTFSISTSLYEIFLKTPPKSLTWKSPLKTMFASCDLTIEAVQNK